MDVLVDKASLASSMKELKKKKDTAPVDPSALASEIFDHFCSASTLKSILRSYRYLCEVLRVKPGPFPHFYPRLKSKLHSWRAQAIWSKFDKRASHKVYRGGWACAGQRVLVIGAGPCGLRTAIEAQILGAKVVVLEKRDRFSRNNVLHLWPYNIVDLRGLGAKKFYGKFCAGAIDHISIRQLQCILLKVALLLGVEVFENVGFEDLMEPSDEDVGWKAKVSPPDHPVSQYEFDVLIGADGKRNTLHGFKRKEFRGKLAIAITANFINRHTEAESRVEEISGVAFIFNQKFFNDLNEAKGISLENIVYYKDETHYFVMTAKKNSLLQKGVIINNEADTAKLLAPDNINQEALFDYAREAADYATNYKLPHLEFAVNHYGKPDVAMFDFTSMFQADNSCRVLERHGHRLLVGLVGDSLLEPFWPTGTGCARGFFGGLDTCWLMRSLATGKHTLLEALAERESIYRILNQATPENTCKDFSAYTVDPQTRYPTLNKKLVLPVQITHLVDTDNPKLIDEELHQINANANSAIKYHETKEITPSSSALKKKRRRESHVSPDALLTWFQNQLASYDGVAINDMTHSFRDGLALNAIIHRYRPDLVAFEALDPSTWAENNQLAFDILENDLGISPVMTGAELANSKNPDKLTMISYLSQVYELFRRDIPVIKQPKVTEASDDDLLDSQYRHNHPRSSKNGARRKPQADVRKSIGQLLVSEVSQGSHGKKKKRRSKESAGESDSKLIEDILRDVKEESPNKENIQETLRLNRSLQRKRLQKLMERAEESESARKKLLERERNSIKKDERFKVIEEQFCGGPKRRHEIEQEAAAYRENKKPKDLKRAIGKLDKEDWNVRKIENKMREAQQSSGVHKDKVPKWSKAAFQDKFNIMKGKLEKKGDDKQDDSGKYADIDSTLAKLQRKLREGSSLEVGERGANKVSSLADELQKQKEKDKEEARIENVDVNKKEFKLNVKSGSESCHFCQKRVYVVERMSMEGKFFHRSCFRCEYCSILLRMGSYVYIREGPLGGKFFCIPHSTSYALEKYRYRTKADELQDVNSKLSSNKDEKDSSSSKDFVDSLSNRHKERLLRQEQRESTPERVEFTSMESGEEDKLSIIDEDEWTDRNNLSGNFNNLNTATRDKRRRSNGHHEGDEPIDTSEDSFDDLDSDTDDDIDHEVMEGPDSRPLTADDARQLQKYYNRRNKQNEWTTSSSESSSSDSESNYDGESESTSSDDESSYSSSSCDLDDDRNDDAVGGRPPRPALPRHSALRRKTRSRGRRHESSTDSSTEVGSDDDCSEKQDDAESMYRDEFSSRTVSECEFTDSEGKPNPFHKDLEEGCRIIGPESPDAHLRMYKQQRVLSNGELEDISTFDHQMAASESMSKYQYKTPNLSDRLRLEEQKSTSMVQDFSTRRALNLKKSWVTTESTTKVESKPKVKTADVDNRLKSFMDRLSSQQKLLRPAEKPSTEMQHFLAKSMMSQQQPKKVSPAVKSPPTQNVMSPSSRLGPQAYRSISSESGGNESQAKTLSDSALTPKSAEEITPHPDAIKEEEENVEKKEDKFINSSEYQREPEAYLSQNDNETGDNQEEEAATPISVQTKTEKTKENKDEEKSAEVENEKRAPIVNLSAEMTLNETTGSSTRDDEYRSCEEDVQSPYEAVNPFFVQAKEKGESKADGSDGDFHTPGVEQGPQEKDGCELKHDSPVATSSPIPLNFEDIELIDDHVVVDVDGEKKELVVIEKKEAEKPYVYLLADNDITEIYKETNPLERRARMKSCQEKEKNVIQNLIMSKVGGRTPRSSSGVRRPQRTLVLSSNVPPPPPVTNQDSVQTNTGEEPQKSPPEALANDHRNTKEPITPESNQNLSKKEETEKQNVFLPATPLTDPEKFGLSTCRPQETLRLSRPFARYEHCKTRNLNAQSTSPTGELLSPTTSNTSNDLDYMDGIVSASTDTDSKSTSIKSNPGSKKTFMKTISGIFSRSSSLSAVNRQARPSSSKNALAAKNPSSPPVPQRQLTSSHQSITAPSRELKAHQNFRFPKLNFNRSTSLHILGQTVSEKDEGSKMAPKADISELDSISATTPKKRDPQTVNLVRKKLSSPAGFNIHASHPSTPPIPLSRKITITGCNIGNATDSLSENEENESPDSSWHRDNSTSDHKRANSHQHLPPEIIEKIMRRGGKSAKRAARLAQMKRVRKVQEIQRHLEELDVQQKELEDKGIALERYLRGEENEDERLDVNGDETALLQMWFELLCEKNSLVRREQELLVQAKQLELEDQSAKLEVELREHLMLDSRSPESVRREGEILKELLEISEHHENLQSMLEKDKERYRREDKDIEAQMIAQGLKTTYFSSNSQEIRA